MSELEPVPASELVPVLSSEPAPEPPHEAEQEPPKDPVVLLETSLAGHANIPEEDEEERNRRKKLQKRTLPISVWVEILFVALNVLSVLGASWYLAIGITTFGWYAGLDSILDVSGNITRGKFTEMNKFKYSMLQHNEFDLETKAIILLGCSLIIFIGCIISSYGAYYGHPYLLAGGFVLQCLAIPMEISVAELTNMKLVRSCDVGPFRDKLKEFIQWYGIFHPNASDTNSNLTDTNQTWDLGLTGYEKLSALQFDVGCCGVDGWEDYKDLLDVTKIPEEAKRIGFGLPANPRNISGLPNSCCKSYWAQNIYCAEGLIDSKNKTLINSRLNKDGCVKKTVKICERLKLFYVSGVRICLMGRILIAIISCILVFLQIRAIQLISRGGTSGEEEGVGKVDDDNTSELGAFIDLHEDHDPEFGITEDQMHLMPTLGPNTDKIMAVLREKERDDEEHLKRIHKKASLFLKHVMGSVVAENQPITPEEMEITKPVVEERDLSGDSLTFINPPEEVIQDVARKGSEDTNHLLGTTFGQRRLSIYEVGPGEPDPDEIPRRRKGKEKKTKKKTDDKGKEKTTKKPKKTTKTDTKTKATKTPAPKPQVVQPPKQKILKPKDEVKPPKVITKHPKVKAEPPKVKAEPPKAKAEPPKPKAEPPKVITKPPEVMTEPPEVITEPPKVIAEPSEVIAKPTEVKAKRPKVIAKHPKVKEEPPEVIAEPPKVNEKPKVKEKHPKAKPPKVKDKLHKDVPSEIEVLHPPKKSKKKKELANKKKKKLKKPKKVVVKEAVEENPEDSGWSDFW